VDEVGVGLSVQVGNLKDQSNLSRTAQRRAAGRNCIEVGGAWIDDGFEASMAVVAVRAMSGAYFRVLERRPELREVFRLGNHVVWVTPSRTALVIDGGAGRTELPDADIDRLFAPR
jgi:Ca-activated chloride channel family protein